MRNAAGGPGIGREGRAGRRAVVRVVGIAVTVALTMSVPERAARAQAALPLPDSGSRLRIWTPPGPWSRAYVGTLVAATADSLVLVRTDLLHPERWAVSRVAVQRAELRIRTGDQPRGIARGALFGLLGGAVVGGLLGSTVHSRDMPTCCAAAGATILGTVGLLSGSVAGLLVSGDRWTDLPLGVPGSP